MCPQSIQLQRRKISHSRQSVCNKTNFSLKLSYLQPSGWTPTSQPVLEGEMPENLSMRKARREKDGILKAVAIFVEANTGGYFSWCLSSVDNLFKFPHFAFSSGRGELSWVGEIPMGICHMYLVQSKGLRKVPAGFQLFHKKNTSNQKQDLRIIYNII